MSNVSEEFVVVGFLFQEKTFFLIAFTLLTTPKLRLHYAQYNVNTTSTIHLLIKHFLTCLTLIAWIRKESDSYCSKNGKGSHFLLWRNSFLFLLAIKLNLICPLTFFKKQTNGEGDLLSLERLIKYVVNKNIVVKRMDNSKKNILDIKRSGNKLL